MKSNSYKSLFILLSIFSLTAFISVSCSDNSTGPDGDDNQLKIHTEQSLEAQGTGRGGINPGVYTLYSLRENKVITDSASTKWDIGFSGASIIINSSTSGPGQAGAVVLDVPFNEVKKAPSDENYNVDSDAEHAVTWPDWPNYTGRDEPIHAVIPKDNVTIVIRTADGGHYAKIKILGWYKGNPKPDELN